WGGVLSRGGAGALLRGGGRRGGGSDRACARPRWLGGGGGGGAQCGRRGGGDGGAAQRRPRRCRAAAKPRLRHLHLRLHRNPKRRGGDTCRGVVACGSADRSLCNDVASSRGPIFLAELLRGGIGGFDRVLGRVHPRP